MDNEDWTISEFKKTGRAARSIPHPLGRWPHAVLLITVAKHDYIKKSC